MVDAEQNQSSNQRHDEACRLVRLIVADGATEKGSQKSAGDTNEHGNEDTAGLFTRHDELGDRAYDKADDSCPKKMKNNSPPYGFYRGGGIHLCCGERILNLGEMGCFF